MGIGVEEPLNEELVEHDLGEDRGDVRRVDTGGAQCVHVGDFDRRDVFEDQHTTGGVLPIHHGHPHPVVVGECVGEPFGVGCLVEVIDLLQARDGKFFDKRGRVSPVGDEPHVTEPPAHLAQGGEVDGDNDVDAWALHLDHGVGETRVRFF